jgi:hypothetical protein
MSAASINDFKAQFLGGARPNLYQVVQPFPLILGVPAATEKLKFFCKGFELPGVSTNPIEVPYMGRQLKVAGDRTFDDVTMTVINDMDFSIRNTFERWSNIINGHEKNQGKMNPADYQVDTVVNQLDRDGNILKSYILIGTFPTSISNIDLAYDSNDTIEEFTVSFSYQYWVDPINGIV